MMQQQRRVQMMARTVNTDSNLEGEKMVGATGFEPVTTRTPSVCATRLRYAPTDEALR
jgi:hypothetical protein